MHRLDETFANLKKTNTCAMIPFVTVGDPDVATTLEVLEQLQQAGAHMIELGVPYSDPLADGPVIQRATARALAHEKPTTIDDVLSVARQAVLRGVHTPFILFTYYNPVLQYGVEALMKAMQESGVCGIIIPDLPLEESATVRGLAMAYNIAFVPLVAPTSRQRLARIVAQAQGFVYCVSSLGVTGERTTFAPEIDEFLETVRACSPVPVCVGFGISTREQVAHFASRCDGVIVGSALVRRMEEQQQALAAPSTRARAIIEIGNVVRTLLGHAAQ